MRADGRACVSARARRHERSRKYVRRWIAGRRGLDGDAENRPTLALRCDDVDHRRRAAATLGHSSIQNGRRRRCCAATECSTHASVEVHREERSIRRGSNVAALPRHSRTFICTRARARVHVMYMYIHTQTHARAYSSRVSLTASSFVQRGRRARRPANASCYYPAGGAEFDAPYAVEAVGMADIARSYALSARDRAERSS